MTPADTHSLAQRLAEGRLPAHEALRLAMSLAEELRKMHDDGRVHGALTPAAVSLTGTGVQLVTANREPGLVTPYTAPELLRGRAADARSDIFSFGAIVYEMLTSRRAFEGDSPETLARAILNSPPPVSGSHAIDRFVANCLAKEPAARWQRMQKAVMELKLLSVSARRIAAPPRRDNVEALVHAEVQRVASQITTRLESHEKAVAELHRAITDSFHALREQLITLDTQLGAAQQRSGRIDEAVAALNSRITALDDGMEAIAGRIGSAELTLQTGGERITRAEQVADSVRQHSAEFAESAAVQLHALEQTVRSQASAIESARTAMSQTDDLVERVVEALESLQSVILEQTEERSAAVK